MKGIKQAILYLFISITGTQAKAQEPTLRESIFWQGAFVTKSFDDSPFSIQVSVQNRYLEFGGDYQLLIGLGYLRYKIEKHNLTLGAGYVGGHLDRFGYLHLPQLFAIKSFDQFILKPSIRVMYDYLFWGGGQDEGITRPLDNHRYRLMLGIAPKITKRIKLIANTEPFVYQRFGTFQETRSTLGPRFKLTETISVDALYWHRWLNNEFVTLWENGLWINWLIDL